MIGRQPLFIYRDELLGASETFVLAQAESLTHFRPFYVGLRRREGLSLPESRVHIISGEGLLGKIQRARFRLGGPSRSLRALLAPKCPVLVHAHFGIDGCNAVPLARSLNVPLVVSLHGYDVTVADNELPAAYVKRRALLGLRVAKFICVSEFIRKQALAKGLPAEKLAVHYTGVDTEFFSPDALSSRTSTILFVGRLVPKKGCDRLIRAVQRVQQVLPEVRLMIVGEGPLRKDLESLAHSSINHCQFLGTQTPAQVRSLMNRSLVFSTPSVVSASGDAEGFGMVFAEAQAMGLPVVSFASGGIPEAVEDRRTGFLVSEGDEDALASKLLLVLRNRELWNQMSQAARARVKQLFDLRTQTSRLEHLYSEVLVDWHRRAAGAGDPAGSYVAPPDESAVRPDVPQEEPIAARSE